MRNGHKNIINFYRGLNFVAKGEEKKEKKFSQKFHEKKGRKRRKKDGFFSIDVDPVLFNRDYGGKK